MTAILEEITLDEVLNTLDVLAYSLNGRDRAAIMFATNVLEALVPDAETGKNVPQESPAPSSDALCT